MKLVPGALERVLHEIVGSSAICGERSRVTAQARDKLDDSLSIIHERIIALRFKLRELLTIPLTGRLRAYSRANHAQYRRAIEKAPPVRDGACDCLGKLTAGKLSA